MSRRGLVWAGVAACVAAGLIGCLSAGETPRTEAGAIDAKALIADRCTRCHGIERVLTHHFDRAGWKKTTDRMRRRYFAPIDDEEQAAIVDYLTERDKDLPKSD